MALQDWEILPDEGFLEIHDDEGKKIFSRKYVDDPRTIFKKNYFICPQNSSNEFAEKTENPGVPKQLFPLPIQFDPTVGKDPDHEIVRRVNRDPVEIKIMPSEISEKVKLPSNIEQVFFKKMKETEKLAEMKLDSSPRSSNNMGIVPQADPDNFRLNEELESEEGIKKNKNMDLRKRDEVSWEENSGNLNIWKWSLSGIGAICSFGVAAATVFIVILGAKQKNKQNHQQSQKLQFHIYTDDKRLEGVVRRASRLNKAISTATGMPINRDHFSLSGFFDGS